MHSHVLKMPQTDNFPSAFKHLNTLNVTTLNTSW